MDKEIKKCTTKDVELLQKISIETYTDTFGDYNTAENLKSYLEEAYNYQTLLAELGDKTSEFYFVYVDKKLAGYLKINIDNSQTEKMGSDFLEIQRIYIKKDFKRQGLGKLLLNLGIDRAKELGKGQVWLGVWENNYAAQKFYQYMGFERYSAHSFVMGDSVQTDYIFKKELQK